MQQAVGRYYPLPEDANTLSMGGSTAPSCENSACTYLNPAGLGFLRSFEITGTYGESRMSGDEFLGGENIEQIERRGYAQLAFPLGAKNHEVPRYGAVAVGYSRYMGETEHAHNESVPDGHRRTVSYGYAPLETVGVGYALTFYDDQLHSDLDDLHSHARFLHLLGAQFRPSSDLKVGAVFKLGIGQSDTEDFVLDSDGLSRPRQYTGVVGVSKRFARILAAVAFDYSSFTSEGNLTEASPSVVIGSDEEGDGYNMRVGAEAEILRRLFLRGGFRWFLMDYEFKRSDLRELGGEVYGAGFSGGLGYAVSKGSSGRPGMRVDYGFEYLNIGHDGWQHVLTVTLPLFWIS